MQLLETVERAIRSRRLFRPRQRIVVAASGGLDSTVLLCVLGRLANTFGWRLTVAHFNHRLRGRSSDADERLVRRTAAALGLPCIVEQADVRAIAREQKVSIEMAARRLRHESLARVARRTRSPSIALAHHADDQVELFFLRLLRGSGGEGLGGMKWRNPSPVDRRIEVIRPLLGHTRQDLSEFARLLKIQFREDASNRSLGIARNRIRHHLLPWLKKNYHPRVERSVLRSMNLIGADADAVGLSARQWLQGKQKAESGNQQPARNTQHAARNTHPTLHARHAPPSPPFRALPIAVQRQCLRLQLLDLGVVADFDLVERLLAKPGTLVSMGDRFVACSAGGLLEMKPQPLPPFQPGAIRVKLGKTNGKVEFDHVQLRWRVQTKPRPKKLLGRKDIECFDAGPVGSSIVLRHWRPGDRFQPCGMAQAVKLQNLFTNHKIARVERRQLIIATTEQGEPFWVEGLRIGERFKLTNRTTRALQLAWKRL